MAVDFNDNVEIYSAFGVHSATNLEVRVNNDRRGIKKEEVDELVKKGLLRNDLIFVMICLSNLVYATDSQVLRIAKLSDYAFQCNPKKALMQLSSYGLVDSLTITNCSEKELYASPFIFCLTKSGCSYLRQLGCKFGKIKFKNIYGGSEATYIQILSKLSYNNFHLLMMENVKFKESFVDYAVGNCRVDGMFTIPKSGMPDNVLNLFVLSARDYEGVGGHIRNVIRATVDHCKALSLKVPVLIIICEDSFKGSSLYKYLSDRDSLQDVVLFMTDDEYLSKVGRDPLDNLFVIDKDTSSVRYLRIVS